MPMPLPDIEAEALRLSTAERGQLVERLLRSLEPEAQGTPEEVALAWDEEIARRIDELDSGAVEGIPYEQVRAEMRAVIESYRPR
jgi:putative addiction module component (TIGR02574 family)